MKRVIQVALLVFVAASAATLAAKNLRAATPPAEPAEAQASSTTSEVPDEATAKRRVIAYYFYGGKRCPSCRKIESYTHSAVRTGFAKETDSGLLEWRPVNTDEPENAHYVEDYKLYTKQVVLAEFLGDTQQRWKDLDQVWELLNDENRFVQYIQAEIRTFVDGA